MSERTPHAEPREGIAVAGRPAIRMGLLEILACIAVGAFDSVSWTGLDKPKEKS